MLSSDGLSVQIQTNFTMESLDDSSIGGSPPSLGFLKERFIPAMYVVFSGIPQMKALTLTRRVIVSFIRLHKFCCLFFRQASFREEYEMKKM